MTTVQTGKGSKRRPEDYSQLSSNWDSIQWSNKTSSDQSFPNNSRKLKKPIENNTNH
jgi:hypothetical protein